MLTVISLGLTPGGPGQTLPGSRMPFAHARSWRWTYCCTRPSRPIAKWADTRLVASENWPVVPTMVPPFVWRTRAIGGPEGRPGQKLGEPHQVGVVDELATPREAPELGSCRIVPAAMTSGSGRWFSAARRSTRTPVAVAIAESVSPARTV